MNHAPRSPWIPDRWYPLLESRALGRRPRGVERLGRRQVLWRDADGVAHAAPDRCPHRGVALSLGRVREGQLECRYHGFRFAADGRCTRLPCAGPEARIPRGLHLEALPLQERHGLVWTFLGPASHADPDAIPWFDEIDAQHPNAAGMAMEWPQNWVRTLESNFDAHHTPFLHRSVAPGVGRRVIDYEVETDGDCVRTRGALARDDGSHALPFRIEFKAPSVTLLQFTSRIRFVVADCPIDEDRTWRYAVYVQDAVRLRPVGRWLSWLFMQVDWRIVQLHQDLPMVRTQRPRRPEPHCDVLVAADAGTAAFLKLYRRLTQAPAPDAAAHRFRKRGSIA